MATKVHPKSPSYCTNNEAKPLGVTIDEDVAVDLEAGRSPPVVAAANETPPGGSRPQKKKKKKKRGACGSCCRRFACCALLLVASFAALVGALYLAVDPKLPRYTVHALNVTTFDLDSDLTARATFDATVRFENPNRAVGISYEPGSSLAVSFRGYHLAEGAFPAFYQGHRDASLVRVDMGEARLHGTGVVEAMRHINGDGVGELPLVFAGDVPVRVKVGPVTTTKVTPSVRCDLVLDSLTTQGSVRVKHVDCKFSIKLW